MYHVESRASLRRCVIETLELRQLLSSGSLDPTFGGSGVVDIPQTSAGLSFNAVATAVQTDGKVVVVGTTSDHRVGVARFNVNGMLDSNFGTAGEKLFHFSSHQDEAKAVAIQTNGDIVVAGSENAGTGGAFESPNDKDAQIAVARLTPAGALDTSFASSGIYTKGLSDIEGGMSAVGTGVVVQSNGQIIVTGTVGTNSITVPNYDDNFLAIRLFSNGKIDTTYGSFGVANFDLGGESFPDDDVHDLSFAAALDYNGTTTTNANYGKLVIVGENRPTSNAYQHFGLIRLTTKGVPDNSFGGGGIVTSFAGGYQQSIARSLVIMPNDDVVIAGQVWTGTPGDTTDFGIMAFKSNGTPDTSFGSGGTVETDFNGKNDSAASIIIGATGDLIVGGSSAGTLAIAAYTPNGQLDPRFGNNGKITSSQPAIFGMAAGVDDTFVATSNVNSTTERFEDIVPVDEILSFNTNVKDTIGTTASFIVTQSQFVNYDRDIYINIGGTARNEGALINKAANYKITGMAQPIGGAPYVVMPANQKVVTVTLTMVINVIKTPTATAIFSIAANAAYDVVPNAASVTFTLFNGTVPTTTTLNDTADAYVQDGASAGTNFGSSDELEVKKGSTNLNRQSYIKFDLSTLTNVNSVKLQLYGQLNSTGQTNIATQVYGASTSSWSESTVNYNNKPTAVGSALGTITVVDTSLELYEIDITAYVKAQLAAGNKVITLVIKTSVTSTPVVEFDSRESGKGPQLIVT